VKLVRSGKVASLLGVTPSTLAVWRKKGIGPQGWVYTSKTQIMYPEEAVRTYLETLSNEKPKAVNA
jgi:predicted site-specific integrase-resolvase